jgi:uncharacterized protein (TIGR02118 family)
MVKVFWQIRRRPDMSAEEFHRYWREIHGPLFWNCSAARKYVVRYEQHRVVSAGPTIDTDVDGVTVLWFDSLKDVDALYADPEFINVVAPDGAKFIDLTSIRRVVTDAEVAFVKSEKS